MSKYYLITFLSCFTFCSNYFDKNIPTPIGDSLGTLFQSVDSVKNYKEMINSQFGQPNHKYVGFNLDTFYVYFNGLNYEEICFNDSNKIIANGSGIGRFKRKDIKEEYYNYSAQKELENGYDYTGAIDKAFGFKPINEENNNIRIYYLPSFENEWVIIIDKNIPDQIIRFTAEKGMVWADLHDFSINENGDTVGGTVLKTNDYTPTLKPMVDTIFNHDLYQQTLKIFNEINIEEMDCIRYKDAMMLDGVGIEVHLNLNDKVNRFKYHKVRYHDSRYNKITDLIIKELINGQIQTNNTG